MIKGINNQPYFNLEPYLDMVKFFELQPEIMRGFADAREFAKEGTWMKPGFSIEKMSYGVGWKPIYKAIEEFLALPDNDPIKLGGIDLYRDFHDFNVRNRFTRYIKMAMGAYDPYIYYFLWEQGSWDDRTSIRKMTPEAKFFPNVVKWVENTITNGIFENIGRVIFFHIEADGIPFEHRDLDANNGIFENDFYTPHRNEFIHIRPNTKKSFYLWDPDLQNKIHINSRAAWWNDQDWHGGDRIMEQSYGLRIDGTFTEEFRAKLGINHLDNY
jgi:hypothetical protein